MGLFERTGILIVPFWASMLVKTWIAVVSRVFERLLTFLILLGPIQFLLFLSLVVYGSGRFRVYGFGSGFRVWGLGFRIAVGHDKVWRVLWLKTADMLPSAWA